MARPPDPEKRSQLARDAVAVLRREGLDLPMARLAEALGVKRPTLLYHFPTKAQIVEHALGELIAEQARFVMSRVAAHTHPLDRLFAQVKAIHDFHDGHEAELLFLTHALAGTGAERMAQIVEGISRLFEAQRRGNVARIEAGIAAGTVAPCDAEALVLLVRAVVDGLLLQRVTEGVALEPVHALLWERVLAPLRLEADADHVLGSAASSSSRRHSASS